MDENRLCIELNISDKCWFVVKLKGFVCKIKQVKGEGKVKESKWPKPKMESIKYKMDTLINEKIEAEERAVQLRKDKETFDAEATRYRT